MVRSSVPRHTSSNNLVDKEYVALARRLSTLSFEGVLSEQGKLRHPETVQWFFDSGDFRKWEAGEIDVLWCHGERESHKLHAIVSY